MRRIWLVVSRTSSPSACRNTAFALMLVLLVTARVVQAQPVIGILAEAAPGPAITAIGGDTDVFQQEMERLGYIDGKNIRFERAFAGWSGSLLSLRAKELVGRRINVLVTIGTRPTIAARRALEQSSLSIPIVMVGVGDPVELGLANSLGRPGEFLTGTSFRAAEVVSKGLEFLREAIPAATTIGALLNPDNAAAELALKRMEQDAARLKVRVKTFPARTPGDIIHLFHFGALKKERPDGLIVINDALFNGSAALVATQIRQAKLPAIFQLRHYVELGGLMAYGPDVTQLYRQATHLAHRILKGAKPADLPIEQPTRFELVLNLKTAETLGLTIPQSLLVRADEIIQ